MWQKLMTGLRAKDQSLATGLLLALLVWTLTRIANGIAGAATIEYDIEYTPTVLRDGREGVIVSATLVNLSREASIRNLAVVISDPSVEFIPNERQCAYPAPTWVEGATCDAYPNGLSFVAPWLVPGNEVRMAIKYVGNYQATKRPAVRIRPSDTDTKIRLVKPGFETWITRNETYILLVLAALTLLFLGLSIVAGIAKGPVPAS
ncbi:MAG TPA: hypothetical protein VNU21_11965 [Usitatibacter sp.]|jgi:hypothetical protein|nr:hypothetical protein [Usitatibacter sp.]